MVKMNYLTHQTVKLPFLFSFVLYFRLHFYLWKLRLVLSIHHPLFLLTQLPFLSLNFVLLFLENFAALPIVFENEFSRGIRYSKLFSSLVDGIMFKLDHLN